MSCVNELVLNVRVRRWVKAYVWLLSLYAKVFPVDIHREANFIARFGISLTRG